jgi:hypothetical protein
VDYEVIHHSEILPNGDFKNFKYTIHIEECMISKYTRLKSDLTDISCFHILIVIRIWKFKLNRFIRPFYSAQVFLNIWSGHFYLYLNQIDWLESNGPRIISEWWLIWRGHRKHICLSMVMDEMKTQQVKWGSRLASNNNNT